MDRLHGLHPNAENLAPWALRPRDGHDLRPRLVEFGMQEHFVWRAAGRILCQLVAFEINFLYLVWFHEAERTSCGYQKLLLAPKSGGNVPEAFVESLVGEDLTPVTKRLFEIVYRDVHLIALLSK